MKTQKPPRDRRRTPSAGGMESNPFTAQEQAAMHERAAELKQGRQADGETAVLVKIAEMPEPDRALATRVHAIIKAVEPSLAPRTWYGMPAYALHGTVVCFFQSAHKFNTRYATLGFTDAANLDEGEMWPVAFAIKQLTPAVEVAIGELVRRAMRSKIPRGQ